MLHSRSSSGSRFIAAIAAIAAMVAALLVLNVNVAAAQQTAGEPLLEVPIHKVPEGMTLEDFEDANRRISMGAVYAITPGGMHFYANEDTTGWILLGSVAGGVVAVLVGASTSRDVPQVNEDYETTSVGENLFYKIPVRTVEGTGGNTSYRLKEVPTTRKGLTNAGAGIATAGLLTIVGAYVWDIFHGIRVIEKKRSLARYKFGKLNAGAARSRPEAAPRPIVEIKPMIDPQQGAGGLQVEMRF